MADRFVVIGAGPAGLTAAYQLVKERRPVVVLEKDKIVGGLARTESYKDFRFDMGGHRFFTKAPEVQRMWREVLGGEFLRRPRLSRIYYRGKYYAYPLKPFDAVVKLGFLEGIKIGTSYLRWKFFPYKQEETFEQWVTNRFGKRLFQTFFKAYTEKVWGIPCSELRAEWAAQRIKDLSLRTAIFGSLMNRKKTIRTLIEEFDYPRLGPGMMWNAVTEAVRASGNEVRLEADVTRILRRDSRIEAVVAANETIRGDQFISSMPVTELVQKLDPPPPPEVLEATGSLNHRDFLTVCLVVARDDLFPDNWIYVQDPDVAAGRIQNFKNWSPAMVPDQTKTSLGLEYFCNEGDDLWKTSDQQLIDLGKRELEKIGLAKSSEVVDGCVFRVPKAYPVYDSTYAEPLRIIRGYVDGFENLQTIGRNGLHRYNNQDHAMLTGMLAVENALTGSAHDLWAVNTDEEYHEEMKVPTDDLALDSAVGMGG